MIGYVLLLHGVNVGGNRKVPMADLRALLTDLGHDAVATHLNSGNAVFGSTRTDVGALADEIRAGLKDRLGLDVPLQLRTAEQLQQVITDNPIPEAIDDASHLLVVFLDHPLPAAGLTGFDPAKFPHEVVAAHREHVYIWYRTGIGTSKLTMKSLGTQVGSAGTGRNWNTVGKLLTMALDREN